MGVTQLKQTFPRSPALQDFALVVSRYGATEQYLERVRRGIVINNEQRWDIRERKEKAEAALAEAKAGYEQYCLNNALGLKGREHQPSLDEARANVAAAVDALEINERVKDRLALELKEAESNQFLRKEALQRGLIEALRAHPAVVALLHEYEACQRRSAMLQIALQEINIQGWIPIKIWSDIPFVMRNDAELGALALRWRAALAALETNPDAELPGLE